MSPELQEKLYQSFPGLYALGIQKSGCMSYGICVDNGWFDLLWNLSEAIEAEARRLNLFPGEIGYPQAQQVKEKFGTLRFYVQPILPPPPEHSEEELARIIEQMKTGSYVEPPADYRPTIPSIYKLAREAESASAKICERCGASGELRQGGWFHTYCDACEEDYLKNGR